MSAAKLTQRVRVARAIMHRMLARMVFIRTLLLARSDAPISRDRSKRSRRCKCLSKCLGRVGLTIQTSLLMSSGFMSSTTSAPFSLTIGTPCFGGQVSWLYAVSLLKLQKAFTQRGWNIDYLLQAGDALVTRARQTIVGHFLDNRSATHLLFIDADIGFEPEQV